MGGDQISRDGDVTGFYPLGLSPNPFAFNTRFGGTKDSFGIRNVFGRNGTISE